MRSAHAGEHEEVAKSNKSVPLPTSRYLVESIPKGASSTWFKSVLPLLSNHSLPLRLPPPQNLVPARTLRTAPFCFRIFLPSLLLTNFSVAGNSSWVFFLFVSENFGGILERQSRLLEPAKRIYFESFAKSGVLGHRAYDIGRFQRRWSSFQAWLYAWF